MGKGYSTDLRERVLQTIEVGMSKTLAHRTFHISCSTINRSTINHWFALRERTGHLAPPPSRRSYAKQLEGAEFEEFMRRHAHATLGEMARAWQQEKGVLLEKGSIVECDVGFALSVRSVGVVKKSWCYKERDEARRAAWIMALEEVAVCARVYVDETGCDDRLQREYGWSVRGEPCFDRRVGHTSERFSVVSAWQPECGLIAPLSFSGTGHSPCSSCGCA